MKWTYDPEADAAIDESEEVTPGVLFDFDDGGRIVVIEVLNAPVRLPKSALVPEAASSTLLCRVIHRSN
jgi:uncharacterized protein YuzE